MNMYRGRDSKWSLLAGKLDKEGVVNSSIHIAEEEVRAQLDSCQNKEELQPQKRGRSVVEGSLEANESFWVLLLGAFSFLCCRDFMGLLQLWETKGRGWVHLPSPVA